MALKMRLRRIGAKKQPAYRVVIADARAKRDGRFVEIIGHYNPLTEPATLAINAERALYWLRVGAQPTDIIQRLLAKQGIWDVFTGAAPLESLSRPAAPAVVEDTPLTSAVDAAPAIAEEAPAVEAPPAVEASAAVEEVPAVSDATPEAADEA